MALRFALHCWRSAIGAAGVSLYVCLATARVQARAMEIFWEALEYSRKCSKASKIISFLRLWSATVRSLSPTAATVAAVGDIKGFELLLD